MEVQMEEAPSYEGEEESSSGLWEDAQHMAEGDDGGGDFAEQHVDAEEETRDIERIQTECINTLGTVDSIMESSVGATLVRFMSAHGDPKIAIELLSDHYTGLAQMANVMSDWLGITGVSTQSTHDMIAQYIRTLIIQYFNKEKADAILMNEDTAPDWLDMMISQPLWRALLCELSEIHPDSFMLKFSIQRISDAGYLSEIANVTTASTYIDVFNRVLLDCIQTLLLQSEDTLATPLAEISKITTYTASTYIHTQVLLNALVRHPNAVSMKRLSQEIANHARQSERNVLHLSLLLSGATRYPEVAASLHSLLGSGKVNPGDVVRLQKAYSSPDPPPSELIRLPELIEMLVEVLFNPEKASNTQQHKAKYVWLLAYAVSVHDTESGPDTSQLDSTVAAIEGAQTVCHKNYLVWADMESAGVLVSAMQGHPVVAAGVLRWISMSVSEKDFFATNFTTGQVPLQLALLDRVTKEHPMTRPGAFALLTSLFESSDLGLDAVVNVEMKKIFIDRMLYLMSCGYVMEVLQFFEDRASRKAIDHTLLRYFVTEVFIMIGPPFSPALVSSLVAIAYKAADAIMTTEAQAAVSAFIRDCQETDLDPAHHDMLQALRARLQAQH